MRSKKTSFFNQSGIFSTGFGIALIAISLAGLALSFSIINRPVTHISYASSCGCSPPPDTHGWTDNMCFFPPETSGCIQTFPGGYCDPNGDKSYEDANWIQGYNDYRQQCGKPSPTAASPTSDPGNSNPTPTPASGNSGTPAAQPTATPTGYVTPTYLPYATPTIIPTNTPRPSPTPSSAPLGCKMLQKNGDPSSKYDLVFIPAYYTDEATFISDAKEAAASINITNLGELLNKFNFEALTLTDSILVNHCNNNFPCWDADKAKELMRKCKGDGYVIILYTAKFIENDDKAKKDHVSWGKIEGLSEGFGNNGAIVLRLGLQFTRHELGHSLASANDEYEYGIYDFGYTKENGESKEGYVPFFNCSAEPASSDTLPCPKWSSGYPSSGCYKTCSYSNWYRSTYDSAMNNSGSFIFNEPTLYLFKEALKNFN